MKFCPQFKPLFFLVASATTLVFSQQFTEKSKIVAGYYPDWGIWNNPSYTVDLIPYNKLTHVIWSFVSPDADGSLRGSAIDDSSDLDNMVTQSHAAGIKAILSLGGAGLCENFASVSANKELRSKFVKELIDFVTVHSLDGIDMDWEYSKNPVASEDTVAYNNLLKDIRAALPENKTLSAALPCSDYYGKFFTAEVLLENLDWFGFMTYDITGDWDEKARFDSPLYPNTKGSYTTWSWKQTAAYWSKRGVPAEKMVFGVPSFGFIFSGTTGPGTDFVQAEYTGYAEIMSKTDWQFFFDDVSKEPYAMHEDLFATYEDARSVTEKSRWIHENKYAGAMVWDLSLDYSENEGQPLIEALSSALIDGVYLNGIAKREPTGNKNIRTKYVYDALGKFQKNYPAKGPIKIFCK